MVARPDTTPPTVSAEVSGTRDDNGDFVGRATVTVTAADTESGVDRIEYSLDGGEFVAYAGPVGVTVVGAHVVRYRARDRAGNVSAVGEVAFRVVEGGPDAPAPCRRGVHACRPGDLPYWLNRDLWEVELEGELAETDYKPR